MNHRLGARLLAVPSGVLACLLLAAGAASAEVQIVPDSAPAGSSGTFSFRVPSQRAEVATTSVEVAFPRDHPITAVTVPPAPGWNTTVSRRAADPAGDVGSATGAAAVSSILWQGDGIEPGATGRFAVSMGPLPPSGRLVFTVRQTYADGTLVRWTDEPAQVASGHPAPVLTVTAAAPPALPADKATGGGLLIGGALLAGGVSGGAALLLSALLRRPSGRHHRHPDPPAPVPARPPVRRGCLR